MPSSKLIAISHALVAGTALLTAAAAVLTPAASLAADTLPAHPHFLVLRNPHPELALSRTSGLTTWNFAYSYKSSSYNETFVGNPPSGASSTTPSFIIPREDRRRRQDLQHSSTSNPTARRR